MRIPATALILAPREFYLASGKKRNSVEPATSLDPRFKSELSLDVHLSVWDRSRCEISPLLKVERIVCAEA